MRWMTMLLLLVLAMPADAQVRDPAGRWAVRSQGRVMMIVTLVRDGARWRGNWLRPDRFSTDSQFASLVSVQGPAVERALVSATPGTEGLDLVFSGREAGATDRMTLGVRVDGTARFVFAQNSRDAFITLTHATTGERPIVWDPAAEYPLDRLWATNARMTALYDADQRARDDWDHADYGAVARDDAVRRVEARALLDAGTLESGGDFLHAAFVFQHGDVPDDYLLAHVLATVAVARGERAAVWIAAATLDRYLQNIGKPQVLGTQFSKRDAWTQEPYARALVPDSLRAALGVPRMADQMTQFAATTAGK